MSLTLAFPVAADMIEGLDFVLAERRKSDPATPARYTFLAELVQDAVAFEIRRLKDGTAKKRT